MFHLKKAFSAQRAEYGFKNYSTIKVAPFWHSKPFFIIVSDVLFNLKLAPLLIITIICNLYLRKTLSENNGKKSE